MQQDLPAFDRRDEEQLRDSCLLQLVLVGWEQQGSGDAGSQLGKGFVGWNENLRTKPVDQKATAASALSAKTPSEAPKLSAHSPVLPAVLPASTGNSKHHSKPCQISTGLM